MGQAWTDVRNPFHGRELRERQLKEISDRVFNDVIADTKKDYLSLESPEHLYIAVLLVFNDINKHFPGPHTDPPLKQEVQEKMQNFDRNLNKQLEREEFSHFIEILTTSQAKFDNRCGSSSSHCIDDEKGYLE